MGSGFIQPMRYASLGASRHDAAATPILYSPHRCEGNVEDFFFRCDPVLGGVVVVVKVMLRIFFFSDEILF